MSSPRKLIFHRTIRKCATQIGIPHTFNFHSSLKRLKRETKEKIRFRLRVILQQSFIPTTAIFLPNVAFSKRSHLPGHYREYRGTEDTRRSRNNHPGVRFSSRTRAERDEGRGGRRQKEGGRQRGRGRVRQIPR